MRQSHRPHYTLRPTSVRLSRTSSIGPDSKTKRTKKNKMWVKLNFLKLKITSVVIHVRHKFDLAACVYDEEKFR